MGRKPDASKIEAALKRAAWKAQYGTREERSGKYLGPKVEPKPASDKGVIHRVGKGASAVPTDTLRWARFALPTLCSLVTEKVLRR